MAVTVTTYDPKKVIVSVGGVAITGFASDGKVTLSRTGDSVTPYTGVDGDVTYTENADKTGTAALTLKSMSSSLSYLRSLADAKTGVNFSVMDMNAADPIKVSCDECRVQKVADAPRTSSVGSVSVTIHIPELIFR